MDSSPEYEVYPERDRHGVQTGRYVWEVYDAETNGPIDGGVAHSINEAATKGAAALSHVERSGLYESCNGVCDGFLAIGTDACSGCCGRR